MEKVRLIYKDKNFDRSDVSKEKLAAYLLQAVADEINAWFKYMACLNRAVGHGVVDIAQEFKEHEKEELNHVEMLNARLDELGVASLTSPAELFTVNYNPYEAPDTGDVAWMLYSVRKDEEGAIAFYKKVIAFCKDFDPVTAELLISILADEEKHLSDINTVIEHEQ